eukprot:CAMPEP_0168347742 /NCGR_PEP_ID=MMETSP0213-20121227/19218_1 /TAXON_ID=151035 /ORGANISM="Euplotes harpa, Strain FSP1.4" /LENGTH=41 /DNA_ID= /DNA_START= /DNA_END= /DNA_ORIENTATION=
MGKNIVPLLWNAQAMLAKVIGSVVARLKHPKLNTDEAMISG